MYSAVLFVSLLEGRIQRCHGVVQRLLEWTGLQPNSAKCAYLAVKTGPRGFLVCDASARLELQDETIAPLSLNESYRYRGVGDGYDHVLHRLQLEPKIQ
ncbi:unnamed protein product [Peronospora destructor]|uniref:Uncharacterized protein n=1 Tax=Peronospora destructor TaxID=86335 RepID=A0AAV0SZC7_9STRA|nr:unnamed protein product [Peronospora destructor]